MTNGNINDDKSHSIENNENDGLVLCIRCRKWLPEDFSFCPFCGRPIRKYGDPEDGGGRWSGTAAAVYAPPEYFGFK